jgi:hypothetical protein
MTHNIQKTLQITQGFLKEKGIGDVVYRDLSNLKKYILEKNIKMFLCTVIWGQEI